jgi:putative glutathione S-transferase
VRFASSWQECLVAICRGNSNAISSSHPLASLPNDAQIILMNTNTTETKGVEDDGEFVREATTFRDEIEADSGAKFAAVAGRYHLYVSYACPWAHRTLLTRGLKGLTEAISFDVVDTYLGERGWTLTGQEPGATGDSLNHFTALRDAYLTSSPDFEGRVTVPVLWDKQSRCIVNNESSEIIRFFNSEFQAVAEHPELDLYPTALRSQIDEINEWVYECINNGVYRAGFARSQAAYERAVDDLFEALDRCERLLSQNRYLTGPTLTEADIRLFPTLVRLDLVYHTHFKCNLRRIVDYPNLWGYTRDIYSLDGIAETINVEHIKKHYYCSHDSINPFGIIARGPDIDFTTPHGREARFPSSSLEDPVVRFVRSAPVVVAPTAKAGEVLDIARKHDAHHLVVSEGSCLGVICTCDLHPAAVSCSIEALYVVSPATLDASAPARRAVDLMDQRRIGSVLVLEGGQPAGFVTRGDLLEGVSDLDAERWRCECCGLSEHVKTNDHGQTLCLGCRERAQESQHFESGAGD